LLLALGLLLVIPQLVVGEIETVAELRRSFESSSASSAA
jgi:hypothetical protein